MNKHKKEPSYLLHNPCRCHTCYVPAGVVTVAGPGLIRHV